MFWHEEENDINLISFNKSNYLKMLNPKNAEIEVDNQKENKQKILDISDNFRIDMMVPTNWGPGKVVNIDDLTKKVTIKIEGVEQVFDMFEVKELISPKDIKEEIKEVSLEDIDDKIMTIDDFLNDIEN